MRIVKKITNFPWLNIKEVADADMGVKAYQFAERKGVDSVAFICYNEDSGDLIVNNEVTPPVGLIMKRAFGGSLDKDKSLEIIVQEEAKEEVGYDVDLENIIPVGISFVSTQMNQFCHLYLVKVKDSQKNEREPENASEAISEPIIVTEEEIMYGSDWKAVTILSKAKYKKILN